ncbi:protein high chlorophyll fluorescent [Salix suchowensis]|nr:protein high chlorophyll fluorescent [Salix suchowensis]
MHLFSPSSSSPTSKATLTLFSPSQNPNNSSNLYFKIHTKTRTTIPCSSKESPPPESNIVIESKRDSLEGMLVVRRPEMEVAGEDSAESSGKESDDDNTKSVAVIDVGLEEFAKKMSVFEPERVGSSGSSPQEKPLNVLARRLKYKEAEEILQKCTSYWPEDGRPYVALGKILGKQSKTAAARAVYEKGCQATQGENPYIWQCWAVLENKMGNMRRARELFDAATVADKRHVAAWHGWAILELKQGNVKKARQLLAKGLKFCGGNEYVYQTLALLEAKQIDMSRLNTCSGKQLSAWAQLEMQKENNLVARKLFEKLLTIGHALNPRDPVLLQSLALLEYKHSTANLARVLFRKASELDPRHQPVWIAWGWMEWKEGNIPTARELYQKALSIDSTTESAARCLQAWGVLEQRAGNLSAARRLFRSSLNINSQSYVTWMTWAKLEDDQGNNVRAEEIRNLYFQQRTEVVDDVSWVTGFLDILDPAVDSIKKLLNMDQDPYKKAQEALRNISRGEEKGGDDSSAGNSSSNNTGNDKEGGGSSGLDLDSFIKERLSLDATKLDVNLETSAASPAPWRGKSPRSIWKPVKSNRKNVAKF